MNEDLTAVCDSLKSIRETLDCDLLGAFGVYDRYLHERKLLLDERLHNERDEAMRRDLAIREASLKAQQDAGEAVKAFMERDESGELAEEIRRAHEAFEKGER